MLLEALPRLQRVPLGRSGDDYSLRASARRSAVDEPSGFYAGLSASLGRRRSASGCSAPAAAAAHKGFFSLGAAGAGASSRSPCIGGRFFRRICSSGPGSVNDNDNVNVIANNCTFRLRWGSRR